MKYWLLPLLLAATWQCGLCIGAQGPRPLVRRAAGAAQPKNTDEGEIDDDTSAEMFSETSPESLEQAAGKDEASLAEKGPRSRGGDHAAALPEDNAHQWEHSKTSEQELQNMVKMIDADKDGKLSWLEVEAFFNREGETDELTQEEIEAGGFGPMSDKEKKELKDVFKASDADHDGFISKAELESFLSNEASSPSTHEESKDGESGDDDSEGSLLEMESRRAHSEGVFDQQPQEEGVQDEEKEIMASFHSADSNKDGQLSFKEILAQMAQEEADHQAAENGINAQALNQASRTDVLDEQTLAEAKAKFKESDTNHDGFLSHTEFKAMIQDGVGSDDQQDDHDRSEEEMVELSHSSEREEDEAGGGEE